MTYLTYQKLEIMSPQPSFDSNVKPTGLLSFKCVFSV